MSNKLFKQAALVAAMGVGGSYALTASAADVGNLMNSADGRFKLGLHVDASRRDVRQSGTSNILSATYTEALDPDTTYTENFTEGVSGLRGKERQDQLYAKLSFAVTPKIEVYGKLGFARSKIKLSETFTSTETYTETFSETGSPDFQLSESWSYTEVVPAMGYQKGDTGYVLGIGAKATLHEWEQAGWRLVGDLQWQYKRMDGSPFAYDEIGVGDDITTREVQGALMLAKNTGPLRPYFGVSYSDYKSDYDTAQYLFDDQQGPSIGTGTMSFKNADKVGGFAGFEYAVSPTLGINGELRIGAEEAITLGVHGYF